MPWLKHKKDHRGEAKGTWYMVSETGEERRWHGPYPSRQLAEAAMQRRRLDPHHNIVRLAGPWPTKRTARLSKTQES